MVSAHDFLAATISRNEICGPRALQDRSEHDAAKQDAFVDNRISHHDSAERHERPTVSASVLTHADDALPRGADPLLARATSQRTGRHT
jgi:hypothetical protein